MADLHKYLHNKFGPLVRFPSLLDKPSMVICLDPKNYEVVFRTEGAWPNRRGIETFRHYREKIRPEVFHGYGGLVNDQGETWYKMRTAVNPVMLRPLTVKAYVPAVDQVAREFVEKMHVLRDANEEMPADFGRELSLWALESIGMIALDRRLGVMVFERDDEAEKLITVCTFVDELWERIIRLNVLIKFIRKYILL